MAINTNCNVTNSSGQDAVVLNAFNSSTNVASNSTKQGYMQELTSMKVGAGSVLKNSTSGVVTMDGTYVNSKGETKPSYIYDLLFSKPDSLFPVMIVGESLDFDKMAYPDINLTEAASGNMIKALAFCQNIMTSPSSKMAVAFQAAMTAAFKKSTLAETEQAMLDFFNQYPTFAGLDFPSYVAVSTYLQAFAYVWGMDDAGKPGTTYYVYSAGKSGGAATTSEGKIVFDQKSSAPSPADPSDPNSGFDITFTPSDNGTPQSLNFAQGQLIDSSGGAVALNGSFGFKGTFTGKDADTTVWPIFSGTMLNKKVMAIPLSPESGWDKFLDSLSFQKLLGYFLQAMGVWMAIDFLKQKLTGKEKKLEDDKANENKGADPDAEQQADAQQAGEDVGDAAAADDQTLADNASGGDVTVPTDQAGFDSAVDSTRSASNDAFTDIATDNISGGIDSAKTQLDDLSQIENNPDIEEAEGNLVDANESLQSGDLSAAGESLGDVTSALPDIVENMGDKVSQELKEQVDEAVAAQEEAQEVAEETSESGEDAASGDEPAFDDPVIPEV